MLAGNGHAVLVNVRKASRGMSFTARRKIVHSNFGLNFVLTFRESLFCWVPRWTLQYVPISFAIDLFDKTTVCTHAFLFSLELKGHSAYSFSSLLVFLFLCKRQMFFLITRNQQGCGDGANSNDTKAFLSCFICMSNPIPYF